VCTDVHTDLTSTERLIAAWHSTLLHGPYDRGMTMDPKDCTIVDIYADADAQETRVKLSDGSVYRSAGIVASSEFGGCARLELTPIGEGTTDIVGPVIDQHACDLLAALGADVSIVRVPPTPILVASDPAPDPVDPSAPGSEPPTPVAPVAAADPAPAVGLVLTADEHAHTKSLAERIESFIGDEARDTWNQLRALLGHL
jgi:hypothetical protein